MSESVVVIVQEATYTFRCLCEDCGELFDLFGQLKPYGEGGDGASSVEQRVCEHLEKCRPDRTKIGQVDILQNRKDATIYRLTAEWTEAT